MFTSNQKGAIAETAVFAVAAKLGIVVYRPVVDGGRCDFILELPDGRLLRVQCKWAPRRGDVICVHLSTCRHTPREGYVRTTYSADEVDVVAAYCAQLDRVYLLPPKVFAGKTAVQLRLSPSKNNQNLRIHWARDYELGAIAQLGERRYGIPEVAGSSPASSMPSAGP